jgi:hypothetical protein
MVNERSTLEELQAPLVQRRISRASFLRLLGAGVGLSLVPASLAALGGSEQRPNDCGDAWDVPHRARW